MKLPSVVTISALALMTGGLAADQMTVSIDAFNSLDTNLFKITSGSDLSLRVSELVPAEGSNSSTHILIEGLSPLEDGTNVYASPYTGVDVGTGDEQDAGMLYLEMPAGAALPEGSVASPIVGVVSRPGPWDDYSPMAPSTSVGGSSGTGDYDSGQITLNLARDTDVLTGVTDYTVVDEDTIVIDPFTITVNAGVSYDFSGATLMRDDAVFYGTITNLSNGAQYDSLIFSIGLTGIPDVDSDGIPDISDSEVSDSTPAVIQWFNTGTDSKNETVPYAPGSPWHWSYTYKGLSVEGMPDGFVWMREFGSVVYPFQDSGTPDGAWFYFFDFPKRDGQGNFVYLSSSIFKNRMDTAVTVLDGWAYVIGAGYDKWYVVKEFDDIGENSGTYMFSSATDSYRLTMEP
ncbi:MAG: hypothetical protein AB3N63_03825 [Puniceicoccaceae bacterium]